MLPCLSRISCQIVNIHIKYFHRYFSLISLLNPFLSRLLLSFAFKLLVLKVFAVGIKILEKNPFDNYTRLESWSIWKRFRLKFLYSLTKLSVSQIIQSFCKKFDVRLSNLNLKMWDAVGVFNPLGTRNFFFSDHIEILSSYYTAYLKNILF